MNPYEFLEEALYKLETGALSSSEIDQLHQRLQDRVFLDELDNIILAKNDKASCAELFSRLEYRLSRQLHDIEGWISEANLYGAAGGLTLLGAGLSVIIAAPIFAPIPLVSGAYLFLVMDHRRKLWSSMKFHYECSVRVVRKYKSDLS